MADPISTSQARVAHAVAANRSTLDKLGKKPDVAIKSEQPTEAKAQAKPQGADSVNLSNVKQRIDDQPGFDRAKVDAIKAAIQSGNYPVNPRRIAENFVSLEKIIQG
jgi:negative regulator of flagellin synthesis FlgM